MCVFRSSKVLMADGNIYSASNIMVGDVVKTPFGYSRVKFIIETKLTEPIKALEVSNLIITQNHPIKINGKWILPEETGKFPIKILDKYQTVYSFVLESHHSMYVDGIEVLCVGHDFYVKGSKLGSPNIVDELSNLADTDDIVRFRLSDFITEPNGKVCIAPDYYANKKSLLENREYLLKTMLKMFE